MPSRHTTQRHHHELEGSLNTTEHKADSLFGMAASLEAATDGKVHGMKDTRPTPSPDHPRTHIDIHIHAHMHIPSHTATSRLL